MKCTLLCPACRPFTPFTFTIQPHSPVPFTARFFYMAQVISKVVSLYQGVLVGVERAQVAICFR